MDCGPQHYSALYSSRSRGHTAAIGIPHFLQAHVFSDVRLAYCLFPFFYCFPDTHVFLFLILSRVFIFLNQERTLSASDILCFLSETSFNVTDLQLIFSLVFNVTDLQLIFSLVFISALYYWVKLQLYYLLQCLTTLFLTKTDSGSLKSTLRF